MERARSSAGVYVGMAGDNGTIVSTRQLCWFTLAGDPARWGMPRLWQIHSRGEIKSVARGVFAPGDCTQLNTYKGSLSTPSGTWAWHQEQCRSG